MVGDSQLYVRRVGERHKTVRKTDSGFGVDAQAGPGSPSNPDPPLPIRSSPHDLCHGWDLLWWLPAIVEISSFPLLSLLLIMF